MSLSELSNAKCELCQVWALFGITLETTSAPSTSLIEFRKQLQQKLGPDISLPLQGGSGHHPPVESRLLASHPVLKADEVSPQRRLASNLDGDSVMKGSEKMLDKEDRAGRLEIEGVMLRSRYERTRKLEDLEEAIQVSREIVKITPEGYPNVAARLNSLGTRLRRRYEHTKETKDLEEAIVVSWQAVNATPKDHPDLAAWLNNLGISLVRRYDYTHKIDDLEEAIRIFQQAVKATPKDHPNRAAFLNNLRTSLARRYDDTRHIEDLEMATQVSQQADELTSEDHPNLAAFLNNLETSLVRG